MDKPKIDSNSLQVRKKFWTELFRSTVLCAFALSSVLATGCSNPLGSPSSSSAFRPGIDLKKIISPGSSELTVSSAVVTSGSQVTVRFAPKDSNGQIIVIQDLDVNINLDQGSSTGTISERSQSSDGSFAWTVTGLVAGSAVKVNAIIDGNSLAIGTLPSLQVVPGAIVASKSTVSVGTANLAAGSSTTVTLQAKDLNGNNLATTSGAAVAFYYVLAGVSCDILGTLVGTVVDNTDGTYRATFGVTTSNAYSLCATIAGVATSSIGSVTVTSGAIDNFLLTGVPASATAGTSFNFTVTARDANNNTKTDYTGQIHFATSDSGAVTLPSDYTFVSGDLGTKQFSTTLATVGTKTITVNQSGGGGVPTVTSSSITVGAGVASAVTSTISATSPVDADNSSTSTITVTVRDASGNAIVGYNASLLTIAANGTGNTFVQPAGVTNSSGQTTGTLKSYVAQSKTITLSAPAGLASVASTSVVFAAPPALAISPTSPTVRVTKAQTFAGSGGVPPYTFSITSGSGSINSSTGVYTAANSLGSTTVRITDFVSSTASATVTNSAYSNSSLLLTSTGTTATEGGYINLGDRTIRTGSISFWFKTSSGNTNTDYFISKVKSGKYQGEGRVSLVSGKVVFQIDSCTTASVNADGTCTSGAQNSPSITSTGAAGTFNNGAWHQVVVTFDPTTTDGFGKNMYLWIDGVKQGTDAYTTYGFELSGQGFTGTWNETLDLGRNSGLVNSYLNGRLDDVAFFNQVLTSTEITEIYASGKTINLSSLSFASKLIHWYKLSDSNTGDTDTGTTITDYVGSWSATLGKSASGSYPAADASVP